MESPKRKVNKLSMSYRSSTPKNDSDVLLDNDYSPLFMSNTQDCLDSVHVVWDWNSPKSNAKIKPAKRVYSSKPSNTSTLPSTHAEQHIPCFNKLKEQLENLRNQLILDNAEKRTKEVTSNAVSYYSDSPRRSVPSLPKPKNLLIKSFSSESLGNSLFEDDFNFSDIIKKSPKEDFIFSDIIKKSPKDDHPLLEGESLDIDIALDEFQEEDYELLSQAIPLKTRNTNVSIKSEQFLKESVGCTNSSDKSLCRKSKCIPRIVPNTKQYSQEEIEKKRKLALSKLGERRIEDIIEKKRQQALLRLESSRKKNLKITTAIKRYNSS